MPSRRCAAGQARATSSKKRPVVPIRFHEARKQAQLDLEACAALLGVQPRTVRYWEAGERRIPYAAFRLLRIATGQRMPWPGWQDFRVSGLHLISPEGHRFAAGDLSYLSLTFRQAEGFRSAYEETVALRKALSDQLCVTCLRKDKPRARFSPPDYVRGPETPPKTLNPRFSTARSGQPFGSPPQTLAGLGPHLAPPPRRLAGRLIARPKLVCSAERGGART